MILGVVLLVVVVGVLVTRHRLLPAEETWRVTIDRAQSVLDSNAHQILLWSGSGDLVVLDRATGEVAFRVPLAAPVQNAALLESGVLAHWQEPGAGEATIGVATGPDSWSWQQQVPADRSSVIGVDAGTDRMVLARSGDDPVLQGLDTGTGEVVWSTPATLHSGWLGALEPRHAFFGQTQLGVQATEGRWTLLSTEDGTEIADLGAVEPITWQDHVVGNLAADGCRPAVFSDGRWQPVDWQGDSPPPQCHWLQPASDWGWLLYDSAGQLHLRPVDLDTGLAGADRERGSAPPSDLFPPTQSAVQRIGSTTRLVDTAGNRLWSHDGRARLYPGPDGVAVHRETNTLTELAAASTDVRRLELLSATGESLVRSTTTAAEITSVHLLPGPGVLFLIDDEVLLLGQ